MLYESNGPTLNAFLILSLANLKATEVIDVIREAFSADCVDLTVQGDVEDVEIAMGLRVTRDTAPPKVQLIPGLPNLDAEDGWGNGVDNFPANRHTNPFKHVGRNDPCPCGSGKSTRNAACTEIHEGAVQLMRHSRKRISTSHR